MNRRERLLATLQGKSVDRPAISFYEINGLDEDPDDHDPFNIYSDPSWRPLIELARDRTDRIVMRGVSFTDVLPDPIKNISDTEVFYRNGTRYVVQRVHIGGHVLTRRTRQDPDVNTVWTEEHLLKSTDDIRAFLHIPPSVVAGSPRVDPILTAEKALGNTGIVMIDTPDPLCLAASLFSMAEYTVIAMTEPRLFHRLLDHFAIGLLDKTEKAARALPGRLWRIYGPEYACSPYLPPRLFREYVGRYVTPMVDAIHRYGGYARIHCHGNLSSVLDDIAAMGADGLDPIEPPPQGDVHLSYVRKHYGQRMVLFGNLEVSDIENLPTQEFSQKVRRALDEGTAGSGRGFVLMPSACPYGRHLSALAMSNYETMVDLVETF